jgi:hypothetical protein
MQSNTKNENYDPKLSVYKTFELWRLFVTKPVKLFLGILEDGISAQFQSSYQKNEIKWRYRMAPVIQRTSKGFKFTPNNLNITYPEPEER